MDFFEMTHKWLHESVLRVFLKQNFSKEDSILDIGCGNGNFLSLLNKEGYKNLNACDGYLQNEKITEFASYKKLNLNEPLPYEDASLDVVTFTEVIEHLENPCITLHEIHRILKPEGILLLSTPNVLTFLSRLLFLFEGTLFQFREVDTKFINWPGHITPFFPYMFQEVFRNEYRIESIQYSNTIVPIFGWEIPIRSKYFSNTVILVLRKIEKSSH